MRRWKAGLRQLRPCDSGKAEGHGNCGDNDLFPGACQGRLRKEQSHGHDAGAAGGEGRVERQRRVPLGHHRARRSGKGQHYEYAAVLPRGKAAAGGKGRI